MPELNGITGYTPRGRSLRDRDGKFVATKLEMAELACEVPLETGIRIEPLPIWEEEWEHPEAYSNPRLLHNIDREGIRF